jgi:glycosyltransferase involved in cell wall biosynthesis
VRRTITISVDQLYRRQPGGIGTYVRGLAQGLASLDESFDVVGLGPRGAVPADVTSLPLRLTSAPLPLDVLTRVWPLLALGVPRESSVVHATSMAGPFGGGASDAVHSVAMHDLMWRDDPGATTRAGIKFHEERLQLIARRDDLRVFTTSPGLAERLSSLGVAGARVRMVRLGVDDATQTASPREAVHELLATHAVTGPFTLYAGTREPRKNLERLIEAHHLARVSNAELGPLVMVGPSGWGAVDTSDAVLLGVVERATLLGLYRDATVFAYVPRAEGWGLPPVEALHAGTRVVASSTTPSVCANDAVVLVDPLDVDSIAEGLLRALEQDGDEPGAAARRASVAELTWRNAALDHVAGWQ